MNWISIIIGMVLIYTILFWPCYFISQILAGSVNTKKFSKIADIEVRIKKIQECYELGLFEKSVYPDFQYLMYRAYLEKEDYETALNYVKPPRKKDKKQLHLIIAFFPMLLMLVFFAFLKFFRIKTQWFSRGTPEYHQFINDFSQLDKKIFCYIELNRLDEARELLNQIELLLKNNENLSLIPGNYLVNMVDYYHSKILLAEKNYKDALVYINKLKTTKIHKGIRFPFLLLEARYEIETGNITKATTDKLDAIIKKWKYQPTRNIAYKLRASISCIDKDGIQRK